MHLFFHPTSLFTTSLLISQASACMHYSATFPYSTSLPFEATLTDDGVVTCWISMTYDQHNKQQTAVSNHLRPNVQKVTQMSLTGEPKLELEKKDEVAPDQEQGNLEEPEDNIRGVWLPWEFKCLEGYQAHAGIGLRAVWFSAHGQEFEFVPQCEENVLRERWDYEIDLWCD
jgi:hypothetical protein